MLIEFKVNRFSLDRLKIIETILKESKLLLKYTNSLTLLTLSFNRIVVNINSSDIDSFIEFIQAPNTKVISIKHLDQTNIYTFGDKEIEINSVCSYIDYINSICMPNTIPHNTLIAPFYKLDEIRFMECPRLNIFSLNSWLEIINSKEFIKEILEEDKHCIVDIKNDVFNIIFPTEYINLDENDFMLFSSFKLREIQSLLQLEKKNSNLVLNRKLEIAPMIYLDALLNMLEDSNALVNDMDNIINSFSILSSKLFILTKVNASYEYVFNYFFPKCTFFPAYIILCSAKYDDKMSKLSNTKKLFLLYGFVFKLNALNDRFPYSSSSDPYKTRRLAYNIVCLLLDIGPNDLYTYFNKEHVMEMLSKRVSNLSILIFNVFHIKVDTELLNHELNPDLIIYARRRKEILEYIKILDRIDKFLLANVCFNNVPEELSDDERILSLINVKINSIVDVVKQLNNLHNIMNNIRIMDYNSTFRLKTIFLVVKQIKEFLGYETRYNF